MFGRLIVAAASAAVFGGVLVSCGDSSESDETLKWRSAVDVPMNFSMSVGNDLDNALLSPGCKDLPPELLLSDTSDTSYIIDCDNLSPEEEELVQNRIDSLMHVDSLMTAGYLLDVGKGSVPTASDVMDFLRKLTGRDIRYSVGVTNDTRIKLIFYGMLFPENDSAADMSVEDFYWVIKNDSVGGGRVNVFGAAGLTAEPDGKGCFPAACGGLSPRNDRLDTLVVGDGKDKNASLSYRWLVMLEKGDYGSLGNTAGTTDSIHIKIRMRFSGVNSMDSLFTL